jgi:hypothetical protein
MLVKATRPERYPWGFSSFSQFTYMLYLKFGDAFLLLGITDGLCAGGGTQFTYKNVDHCSAFWPLYYSFSFLLMFPADIHNSPLLTGRLR